MCLEELSRESAREAWDILKTIHERTTYIKCLKFKN